ncbi:MAG: hypothetical protein HY887_05555 [Deltaproteobacteria bacterium]|nr:hypothetical protein [Deltaproteobacteria bacterium]
MEAHWPPEAIRAEALVEMKEPGKDSVKGRAVILVKRPASFRMDISGPFGIAASIASAGADITVFSEGSFKTYKPGGYPVSPEDIVSALLGIEPPSFKESAVYITSLDSSGRPSRIVRLEDGRAAFNSAMKDYRPVSDFEVPFNIEIESPQSGRVSIRYNSVEPISGIGDDAFLIAPAR